MIDSFLLSIVERVKNKSDYLSNLAVQNNLSQTIKDFVYTEITDDLSQVLRHFCHRGAKLIRLIASSLTASEMAELSLSKHTSPEK